MISVDIDQFPMVRDPYIGAREAEPAMQQSQTSGQVWTLPGHSGTGALAPGHWSQPPLAHSGWPHSTGANVSMVTVVIIIFTMVTQPLSW